MIKDFPFEELRPGTAEAIRNIEKAFAGGKRFVLVNAATGAGKSGIAIWFARKEKAVIVTPTKVLQRQYENTPQFDREYTIFGKSNYDCGLKGYKHLTVDDAPCCSDGVARACADSTPWKNQILAANPSSTLKKLCSNAGHCEYYKLRSHLRYKPGAIVNYDLLTHLKLVHDAKSTAVVMDEAHTLIDKARSVFGYKLSSNVVTRLLGAEAARKHEEGPVVWLRRVETMAIIESQKEKDLRRGPKLNKFISRLQVLAGLKLDDPNSFYIDDRGDTIDIKPLDIRYLKDNIFGNMKQVLLLSATFPDNYRELLGIADEESEYINIPSSFPKENRPAVFVQGLPAINWKTVLKKDHPSVKALDHIMEEHRTEKGIIHCANYKIFSQLQGLYKRDARFTWVDRGVDKNIVMSRHENTDRASVLVSPSMMEGVDLKDDLARFQVMLKLPYGALDDYTKQLMAAFPGYYENDVITRIVQAYGRAVRSADDSAVFYILDGAFDRLVTRNKSLFPKYFMEALGATRM